LSDVIISEKTIKKAKKYSVERVPFPFQSREQYERSLQQPLGPEWNANNVHRRAIRPRIHTRAGHIIDPMSTDQRLE
jgi:U3 small nucleolar RNA-associated protein 14